MDSPGTVDSRPRKARTGHQLDNRSWLWFFAPSAGALLALVLAAISSILLIQSSPKMIHS
jgi:hypothetical protein